MLRLLENCDRGLSGLLRVLVCVTSVIVTLALVTLVIARYFFDYSISGMHESSLVAAMWLYMGGAILASRGREHLVVDFLATSLQSSKARALHDLVIAALTVVIIGFFAQWVWGMFAWGMKRPQQIPILNISLMWSQAPLALMVVCGMIYALRDLLRAGGALLRASKEA